MNNTYIFILICCINASVIAGRKNELNAAQMLEQREYKLLSLLNKTSHRTPEHLKHIDHLIRLHNVLAQMAPICAHNKRLQQALIYLKYEEERCLNINHHKNNENIIS